MNHFLESHAGEVAVTAKAASYSVSIGMIASSTMNFMNENVGFIGGVLGIGTFFLNWVYKRKEHKLKEIVAQASIENEN